MSGATSGATLTFRAGETWSVDTSSATNALLASFLDDSKAITVGDDSSTYAAEITVAGIPFETYDVYLYSNVNNGTGFKPIQVNDQYYTYVDGTTVTTEDPAAQWGATAQTTPQLGQNVLVVSGVTGDALTIRTLKRIMQGSGTSNIPRGSFAGFQIVERLPLTINVNIIGRNGGQSSIKDTAGTSGLIPVENANWSEFNPTGASANSGTIENAIDCTGADTTAQFELKMGGGWHLTAAGSEEARTERTQRLGAMGMGYADASETAGTTELTLKDIPYTEYSVILYLATNADSGKWAPAKVTAGKTVKYYAYPSENATDAAVASDADPGLWGTVSACYTAGQVGRYGQDTMLIEELSGDVSIDLGTSRASVNESTSFGGLCGFQIVCTGEVFDPTLDGVMSLNFATGRSSGGLAESKVATETGNYGLAVVPAATWVDLTGNANEPGQTVTTLHGKATAADWSAATVRWKAKNTWSYDSAAAEAAEPFLPTYLGDGAGNGANGVAVSVSSVPFEAYDAIVYFSNDAGRKYRPVQINGTYYTYNDAYGAIVVGGVADATQQQDPNAFGAVGQQATAKLGVNALRVNGLKGEFSLQGATVTIEDGTPSSTYDRCGIAAVQLVARQLITVSNQTNWADISAGLSASDPVLIVFQNGGSITGNVTLPADAILDLSAYTFGNTLPITGTLTMDGGTIRLPDGFESGKIAASISGSFTCFIGDELVWLSNQDGTLSLSYEWWGLGGDDLWSNPLNWSSGRVPNKNAEVSFNLGASDEIVILDKAATVASVTITGSESSAATLKIQALEGGSLIVSGQMLTTGNVTVTQSADITVNGKSTMVCPSGAPQTYPERGAFHVEGAQAEYKVVAGTLSVPTKAEEFGFGFTDLDRTAGGFVVVCDNAKLTVGGGDAEAVLSVYSCRMPWPSGYPASGVALAGTVEVLSNGVFETDKSANFAGGPKLVTNGGTVRVKESLASVTYGSGYAPTSPLTLSAPEGATLTFSAGESGTLLTGSANVLIKGPGTVALVGAIDAETYTGEISVQENGNLTLADNQRPKLTVSGGASLDVTPSDTERGNGAIVFPTSMMETPTGVKYTVSGVDEEETLSVSVDGGKLTLSWGADYPTLSTTSNWSTTESWANLPDGTTYPTSGSVTLDGTAEGGIKVTLDKSLDTTSEGITSIFVKGDVTLVTKGTESTTIPACVALTTDATLTVDADFSGAWELPAGTTLHVTKGFTSFANLKLEGAVVILSDASGTSIKAPKVEFNGGLTIAASNLTLKSVYNVGTTLALEGDNITIEGNSLFTDNGTEVVNEGTDNAITGVTGLNGSLAVNSGALALTLGAKPNKTYFSGATIAENATLTLAGPDNAQQWWFPATGEGTLVLKGAYRPMFSAVSQEATTLPKNMVFTATAEEQADGVIECKAESGLTLPAGFTVTVNPAEGYGAWAPKAVLEEGGNSYLRIYNQLPTNLPAGVEEAVAQAIKQDAKNAGIENKGYAVRLTTGGGRQTVDVTAATLNDVLGCFTGLKATASADKTTLTYAYNFGISGVRRPAEGGWGVFVKVTTGAEGDPAGFAEGNVYTVNEAIVESPDVTQAEAGEVVLPVTEEQLKAGVSVSVARPEATP